jgi:multiple sugar transport system permease protein
MSAENSGARGSRRLASGRPAEVSLRRKGARPGRPGAIPYVFLAPAIALFVAFFALPIGYTVYLSTRRMKVSGLGLGPGSRQEVSVGLDNFKETLADNEFWAGWLRVLGYGSLVLAVMLGLALLFALMLDSAYVRLARFARIAIFLPYAVPGVVASLLWGFLYLPSLSPIHSALNFLGIHVNLFDPSVVTYSMANIAAWGGTGFNMLVLYTSLRAVPRELYEAARIDGAGEVQIALRIKIPVLVPSLILTTVFSIIATAQVFTEPMTLRPISNTISSTWSPLMKVYRDAFVTGDLYAAAATSVVIAAISLVLSFGFLRVVRKRAFSEED